MVQMLGFGFIAAAVIALIIWVRYLWTTTPATTATTTTATTTTQGVTINTTQLATDLSYIESLSKINAIMISPDAVKACDIIADTLWQNAIQQWKSTQADAVAAIASAAKAAATKTVKVTTTDGIVVEVPVQ
jgi:hypothetical protein